MQTSNCKVQNSEMPDHILAIGQGGFSYINLSTATVIHHVNTCDTDVYVIGNGEIGSYEWVVCKGCVIISASDKGYTIVGYALRDGLSKVLD